MTFRQTSDIYAILKDHPAYLQLSGDEFDAIVAGIASTLLLAGGLVLAHVSGGATIVLASVVLTSAGGTGLARSVKGYIEGRFDWNEFATDTLTAAGISFITFGAGYLLSSGVSYLCLKHAISLSTEAIEKIASVTGTISGSATQGSAYALISQIKGEELETFELIIECVTGAIAGAKAAKLAFNGQLKLFSRGSGAWKTSAYNPKPLHITGGENQCNVRVFTSPGPVVGSDFNSMQTQFRNATRSKLVIISGTHGTPSGLTALDSLQHADASFYSADCDLVRDFMSRSTDFFRNRSIEVINLANFRAPGELYQELVKLQADTIVGAFCYAEQAMTKGQLGDIIREAVRAYPASLL